MLFVYEPLLFLLIFPLGFFIYSFKKSKKDIVHLFSEDVIDKVRVSTDRPQGKKSYRVLIVITVFLIIALARPVIKDEVIVDKSSQNSLIIAVDISKSMKQKDIYPSRLELAIAKLKYIVQNSRDMNIGVILFTEEAYSLFPISDDMQVLTSMIKHTNFHDNLGLGSNLFAALQASKMMLSRAKNKNILLLSDGGNSKDMREELSFLKDEKIRLYALNISSKTHKGLGHLALKSGGMYQDFSWGEEDIKNMIDYLDEVSQKELDAKDEIIQLRELFIYPLLVVLFLLLYLFNITSLLARVREFMAFITFMSLATFTTPVKAGLFDFYYLQKAEQFYEDKNYEEAVAILESLDDSSALRYNLANALYRSGRYEEAIFNYKKLLIEKSDLDYKVLHNIANAYMKLKQLSKAQNYYEKSIASNTKSASVENLKKLLYFLEKQAKQKSKKTLKPPGMCHKISIEHNFLEGKSESAYEVKIDNLVSSEEDKWLERLEKQQTASFLQKIKTDKRSDNASLPW